MVVINIYKPEIFEFTIKFIIVLIYFIIRIYIYIISILKYKMNIKEYDYVKSLKIIEILRIY